MVKNWEEFTTEENVNESDLTGRVEIFKEGTPDQVELSILREHAITDPEKIHLGIDFTAFDLSDITDDYYDAEELVDNLNEVSDGEWFVADPTVEMVYVE